MRRSGRWGRLLLGVMGVVLLAACAAPTWSARVTTFQQWPPDAEGKTYRLVASQGQSGSLEYQTFSDMVRANIGRTGLVEAGPGQKARFDVEFEYENPVVRGWRQEYADPFYPGFGPWGPWGGYYGGFGPGWGGGIYYAPPVVTVPVAIYQNSLTVIIRDNARQGIEVYRSRAVSASSRDNLTTVMPYLARAVFDGFPGNNGQTRDITYELPR